MERSEIRAENTFQAKHERISLSIALGIIISWCLLLAASLHYTLAWELPRMLLAIPLVLLMTFLYTGLFITAHDAMHGIVSKTRWVNRAIGTLCALLFSFNFFSKLNPAHHEHHRYVATEKDPDYYHGSFVRWYVKFLWQYVTIWQIVLMAITYNLLKLVFPMENLIVFWMLPAVLSTVQLFYFGTYLPHRGEHTADDPYKSNPHRRSHLYAFITCYFFGYHYEHHAYPATPWWLLWRVKDRLIGSATEKR